MGLSIACLYYRMRSINIEYVLLLYDAFSYYRICAFAQYAVTTSEQQCSSSAQIECVPLLQNAFSFLRKCSFIAEYVLLLQKMFSCPICSPRQEDSHEAAAAREQNVFSHYRICSLGTYTVEEDSHQVAAARQQEPRQNHRREKPRQNIQRGQGPWAPFAHFHEFGICLSIYLSIYLFFCLSVCLSIHPSIYLSVCLSVCPSVYLSIHLKRPRAVGALGSLL